MVIWKNVRVPFGMVSALAIAVSAAACASSSTGSVTSPSAPVTTPAAVTNGTWNLQSLTRADSTTVTIGESGQFTLTMADDGSVALKVDCNRGIGSYALAGSRLSISPLATTKAYCASAPLDDEYLKVVGGESAVTATATTLELSSVRGTLRFGK